MASIKSLLFAVAVMTAVLQSCIDRSEPIAPVITRSGLIAEQFETTVDNSPISLYTLINSDSTEVCISNLGSRIVSLSVDDRDGSPRNIVLGFDSIRQYIDSDIAYRRIGAIAGPYFGSRNVTDGDKWLNSAFTATHHSDSSLTLVHTDSVSYAPGKIAIRIDYHLRDNNTLVIDYTAATDTAIEFSPAQNLYFNLNGNSSVSVDNHMVRLNSRQIVDFDSLGNATGQLLMTAWTPMNVRNARKIGSLNNARTPQIRWIGGLNNHWMLDRTGKLLPYAARLWSSESGIALDIHTSEPIINLRAANEFDSTVNGRDSITIARRSAIMIMPHQYPDAARHPQWSSPILHKGEVYHQRTSYALSTFEGESPE